VRGDRLDKVEIYSLKNLHRLALYYTFFASFDNEQYIGMAGTRVPTTSHSQSSLLSLSLSLSPSLPALCLSSSKVHHTASIVRGTLTDNLQWIL